MANKEETELRQKKEQNLVAKSRQIAKDKLVELFSNDNKFTLRNYLRFPYPTQKKELFGEKRFAAGLKKEDAEKVADKILRSKELMTKYTSKSSSLLDTSLIPIPTSEPTKISCGVKNGEVLVTPCKKEKYASRYETSGIVGVAFGDYLPVVEKIVKPYGIAMKKLIKTDKVLGVDTLKVTSAYPTQSETQAFALKAKEAGR